MAAPDVAREVRYYALAMKGVEVQLQIGSRSDLEANAIQAQVNAAVDTAFSQLTVDLETIDPGIVVRLH